MGIIYRLGIRATFAKMFVVVVVFWVFWGFFLGGWVTGEIMDGERAATFPFVCF